MRIYSIAYKLCIVQLYIYFVLLYRIYFSKIILKRRCLFLSTQKVLDIAINILGECRGEYHKYRIGQQEEHLPLQKQREKIKVDTFFEKVIVNFTFDLNTKSLILISEDETRQKIAISALCSPYQGSDGVYDNSREINKIGASIKAGAITTNKLADHIVEKLYSIVPAREIVYLIYPVECC